MTQTHSVEFPMIAAHMETNAAEKPWKTRLYEAYVSTGQAAVRPQQSATQSPHEVFAPFAPQTRRFIANHLPPDRGARIVDLGCGDGMLLHFLLEAGYSHATGLDVSQEQITRAHRLGLVQARRGEIEDFLADTGSGSVNVVLLIDVLEHLTRDELFRVLEGVARILSAGGTCIAHVPNAEGLYGMRVRYGDLTHEQAFTARSASQAFRAVGFQQITAYEDKPVVHGATSLVRRGLWELGTLPHRILLAAETGAWGAILSQNLVVRAVK
jgi:2-polyprenyl-3-methyl-5-hydroxy-6-metoxy-1,4-benzoquinol methylase